MQNKIREYISGKVMRKERLGTEVVVLSKEEVVLTKVVIEDEDFMEIVLDVVKRYIVPLSMTILQMKIKIVAKIL